MLSTCDCPSYVAESPAAAAGLNVPLQVTSTCHPIACSSKHRLSRRLRAVAGAVAVLYAADMSFSNKLTRWRLCLQLEEKAEREAERAKEKEERDRRRDETRRAKAHGLDDMAVSPC